MGLRLVFVGATRTFGLKLDAVDAPGRVSGLAGVDGDGKDHIGSP